MSKERARRGLAVEETLKEILRIIKDRDSFELLKELARKYSPQILEETKARGDIPKWYLDLVIALTTLYDKGYADSLKDSEQMK